jgi:glycosyltransferase involved in cell wall biosynthesis
MTEPLVSIALCAYNGERYIKKQLESIINQTHRNLEIIIVDDCSTDATAEIIKEFAQKDDRIKFYQNEVNLGYNKNFGRAIGLTTGEYISISDQDDIWELHKIATLLENMGNNWLVFSNSQFIDEEGKTGDTLLNNFSIGNKDYRMIIFTNYVAGHSVLFRREFLNYLLPFPEMGFYDWWMAFVALYHHRIAYIDKVLTMYRKHSTSVIQKILRNDKTKVRALLLNINIEQLTAFQSYKYLEQEDKEFIAELKKGFELKRKHFYSIPLIKMIYKHYDILFSESKPRHGLSRLNFAMKNAKRAKNGK